MNYTMMHGLTNLKSWRCNVVSSTYRPLIHCRRYSWYSFPL